MKSFSGKIVRFLCLWFVPCTLLGQSSIRSVSVKPSGYNIVGHLIGLQDGEKVTMMLSNSTSYHKFVNYLVPMDSAYVKNGEFVLKGFVPEGPRRYWMVFDQHNGMGNLKVIDLVINNNEDIRIISDTNIDKIPHNYIQHYVTIDGSPSNYSSNCLQPARTLYSQAMQVLRNKANAIVASRGFDGSALEMNFQSRSILNDCLYYNFFSPGERDPNVQDASLTFLTEFESSGHAHFWVDVYNSMNNQKRQSFYGKWLEEVSKLCVGQSFPNFDLPTPDGAPLDFQKIAKDSKLTIVHFWSPNSQGKAQYRDELRQMFEKYHSKGLNIVGVFHIDDYSPDSKYVDFGKQWKDIIKSDNLPWYNVADLGGEEGIVEKNYREGGANNTTNVLVNSDGKIIAWDARGADLRYYLWKEFSY